MYQERRQSMEDTLSKFMSESTKRHEENSNLIKEIRASTDAAIRNQGASIKTLEIQIGQMSKVLQERGFGSLSISTEANPRDKVKSISTTTEADSYPIRYIRSSQYALSTGQNPYSEASHIDNSIPRKEKDLGSFTLPCFINIVCFDNALVDLGASVSVMPLSTYLNLRLGGLAHTKLTVELADRTVKYPKGIAKNVLVGIGKFVFPIDFIILDMPEDVKVPLILERPFLSTVRAKIDGFKRKITLRVGEERIIFKIVKPDSSLIKRVYMLSLREIMELDLEARLMGETLVINRSLDPLNGDYMELNDLNEPFELRRDQGDDLMPTIKEGEVIEEFRTRDEDLDTGIDDYPSYCDHDKKIHIDCAHNLKFSCMIGFEFTHDNFFPLLYVNVMSKKFHNSIMKDKMVYKGNNVVRALMNVPIFVGTFSVVTDSHMEYLANISKRRAFWILNEDILKINDFDNQYAISIKEYTAYPCLHSPKTTKERRSIRRIQKKSIRRIEDIVYEYSRRYQTWSLLQETLNTQYSKEEEDAEAMVETIEQYMRKTRIDYGSGFARPKIEEKDKIEEINNFQQEPDEILYQAWEHFKELLIKCPQHYLTEMQKHNETSRVRSTETSDGLAAIQAQLNNLGREIKKVNERVYDAQVGCEQCKGPHYTKDCSLKEEGKTLEEAYYTQFGGPFQRGGYRATAPGTLLYKPRQTTVPFPSHLDNHYCEEEDGNYGPKFTKAYGASYINDTIPRKEKDLGSFTLPCFINIVYFENALVDLEASVSVMPLSTYLNLRLGKLAHTRLTMVLADRTVKYPKGIAENVLVGIGKFTFPLDFIILDMPKITLRVGEEKIIFKSVKPTSSLIKRVYMLSLREIMELDLEARLMGETLVLNRSLDLFLEDYIELNDLNEPFELRRNQEDDLMPTIEEGEVIEEFRTRDDLDIGIDDYPSYYDYDKKIHIDYAHNLKFSCMIGFEFTHVNFFPLLYVNVMSKKFHNSIMKDKMVYKGNNVVRALMNIPIFVGTFSVMTDFVVLENMDAYHNEGIGDIIVGEPFLRDIGIKSRRFDGMITIYNGDDEITYQMVRSHPRFKHHTNEQCNKIPPLLKVSGHDKMNGISHSYQKLKRFYKGVLNLGPDFIRVLSIEEWLTRGHVSMHELE
ncbi:putative reverse transcriptase domain-containing protein [Tanacetum coccineum]